MADLIDSYSESNFSATIDMADTANHAIGQAIYVPTNRIYVFSSAKFYLARVGACTGNCYAKIYAATGTVGTDAEPTGSVLLTSDAVDSNFTSAPGELRTFTFSTPVVMNGGNICVEFYFSGGNYGAGAYIGGGADNTTPSHAGNFYYRNSSDTVLGNNNGTDLIFYLYATEISSTTDYLVFPRGRSRFCGSITGV